MKTRFDEGQAWRRATAFAVVLCLLAPVAATPAAAQIFGRRQPAGQPQRRQGMSTGKKVAAVAGLALLYYLYRKHTAKQAQEQRTQQAQAGQQGGGLGGRNTASASRRPQLYRSRNGGVYYRDAQGRPVWLTVPNRPVQVPVEELRRYAPNYARIRGAAPAAPSGYRTQSFQEYDPELFNSFATSSDSNAGADSSVGAGGRAGAGNRPPGPRSQ